MARKRSNDEPLLRTDVVVSGNRPTGDLHLGHLNGALKNWLRLQREYQCYFFVADWHALTTEYADPSGIHESIKSTVLDWLAVGLDPETSVIFKQSDVPEHAELHLLFSMIVPIPRVLESNRMVLFISRTLKPPSRILKRSSGSSPS